MGFKAADGRPRRAEHAVARKARALWISLFALGAIDNPSERALEHFAKRQLGVDRLQWADQSKGNRLIEALKAIAEREGWDQSVAYRSTSEQKARLLKGRLFTLLRERLVAAGQKVGSSVLDRMNDAELDAALSDLSSAHRAMIAAKGGA